MQKLIKNGLLTLIFSLGLSLGNMAQADEVSENLALEQQVEQLYLAENYAKLDQIYEQALKKQTRTSSGLWLVRQFYEVFGKMFKGINAQDMTSWDQHTHMLERWMKQNPNLPLPQILYAKLLEKRAWAYRGQELASKVSEEGWAGFKKFNEENKIYLASIKKSAAKDPEWYVAALDNASFRNVDEENYQKLFKEATDRHPLYYTLYFNAINYRYLPKWGGSEEEMEQLATYAVSKTRKIEGDALYSRIYWVISSDYTISNLKEDTIVDWERMKKSMDTVLKKYPAEWNYAHFALISCRAKDQEQTSKLFKFIPKFDQNNWEHRGNYNYCKSYATNRLDDYYEKLYFYEEKKREYFLKTRGSLDYMTSEEHKSLEKQFEAEFGPLSID